MSVIDMGAFTPVATRVSRNITPEINIYLQDHFIHCKEHIETYFIFFSNNTSVTIHLFNKSFIYKLY